MCVMLWAKVRLSPLPLELTALWGFDTADACVDAFSA